MIPPPSTLLLPYGTFYDSRNGFAPRVTVTSFSKWKSVLRVRDITSDDHGTYRCVSTAILPDEPEPSYSVQLPPQLPPPPPTSYFVNYPQYDSLELRSAESTVSGNQYDDVTGRENSDTLTSSSSKREGKIKFIRRKREIGAFGVHAPFFKPHYGVYRVFKEIKFFGELFGLGSERVENTLLSNSESIEKQNQVGINSGGIAMNKNDSSWENNRDERHRSKTSGRELFDLFTRRSKVLF